MEPPKLRVTPPLALQKSATPTNTPLVAVLTGGGDRPYALGLAAALIAQKVTFDFIASDELRSPELESEKHLRFMNLRGGQDPAAPLLAKVWRVVRYYVRLFAYSLSAQARIFHILWENKLESFDRIFLMAFYRALGSESSSRRTM